MLSARISGSESLYAANRNKIERQHDHTDCDLHYVGNENHGETRICGTEALYQHIENDTRKVGPFDHTETDLNHLGCPTIPPICGTHQFYGYVKNDYDTRGPSSEQQIIHNRAKAHGRSVSNITEASSLSATSLATRKTLAQNGRSLIAGVVGSPTYRAAMRQHVDVEHSKPYRGRNARHNSRRDYEPELQWTDSQPVFLSGGKTRRELERNSQQFRSWAEGAEDFARLHYPTASNTDLQSEHASPNPLISPIKSLPVAPGGFYGQSYASKVEWQGSKI
jgi:hypothetical protein